MKSQIKRSTQSWLYALATMLLTGACIFALSACTSSQSADSSEEESSSSEALVASDKPSSSAEVKPANTNYLTGEKIDENAKHKRPAAVVIENSPDARPQWGMDDQEYAPDIILQAEVEGGISRTLWFYDDYTKMPDQIGPTRSARPPFIKFSELFDAIFVHWGMSHSYGDYVGADTVFSQDSVDHIDQMGNGSSIFGRDSSRRVSSEHTGVLYCDKLPGLIDELKFRTEINDDNFTKLSFNEKTETPKGNDCKSLKLSFSSRSDSLTWTYDADAKAYTTDAFRNDVKRDNLIVLMDETQYILRSNYYSGGGGVTYCNYKLSGGKGVYASQGKSVDITWSVEKGKLVIKDADGKVLKLNPGKSWIGWASSNNGGSFTVE